MAKTNTAIKYRIYPSEEQIILFQKTFGCCRFVYNTMLSIQEELYTRNGFHLSKYDSFKIMTSELKSKFPFLKEVDSLALMNSIFALSNAYNRFFNKLADKPVFKSRKNARLSYTTNNQNGTVAVSDKYIKLPKIGSVKAKIHRTAVLGSKIKIATISQDCNGKYYCSIIFEYDSDIKSVKCESIDKAIGLDMNESKLYVDSNGNSPEKPSDKKVSKSLKKQQRKLSHMIESHITGYKTVEGNRVPVYDKKLSECKNIQKQRRRIAKTHKKQTNQRMDFLHKTSNQITNDYHLICIEDLSVKDMMLTKDDEKSAIKRHNVNRKTISNGWYSFTVMLDYKAKRKGRTVIKVPKDFPSSQICSCCGHINPNTKDIKLRNWICPECKVSHNRDINAAVNIRNKGYEMYSLA